MLSYDYSAQAMHWYEMLDNSTLHSEAGDLAWWPARLVERGIQVHSLR